MLCLAELGIYSTVAVVPSASVAPSGVVAVFSAADAQTAHIPTAAVVVAARAAHVLTVAFVWAVYIPTAAAVVAAVGAAHVLAASSPAVAQSV